MPISHYPLDHLVHLITQEVLAALPASPPEERETMQEVAALVQSLQFPGAVTIIRRILERET